MKTEEILAIFDQADSLKDVEKYLESYLSLAFLINKLHVYMKD